MRQLHESVRAVIAPRLSNIGFQERQDLLFVRRAGRVLQVIELAARASADPRFTVHLGIFVPSAPDVNGEPLDPTVTPSVSQCHFRVSLGRMIHGHDHLWKTSDAWDETVRQMRDVLRGILFQGLCWLARSSEPTLLVRHCARVASRPASTGEALAPAVLLGLLQEMQGQPAQARTSYRRALDGTPPVSLGLRFWIHNRLHNLPADAPSA